MRGISLSLVACSKLFKERNVPNSDFENLAFLRLFNTVMSQIENPEYDKRLWIVCSYEPRHDYTGPWHFGRRAAIDPGLKPQL